MEKLRSDVISGVRACLISTKGRVELRQLDNDYRTLVGERIPYYKLGFKRLEDFIQSEPTLVISKNSNGDTFVDAKISEKSAHITEMVYKQKVDKKKVLRKAVRFSARITPPQTTNWRPKEMMGRRGAPFNPSPRLAKVSHNQFINRQNYVQPKHKAQLFRQNSEPKKPNINNRLHLTTQTSCETPQSNGNSGKVDDCSPLNSVKKRISQKMSEINIDVAVIGNGSFSPTSDSSSSARSNTSTPPNVQEAEMVKEVVEFARTSDPVADLKSFNDLYKVGELEVSSKLVKTKQNRFFVCRIKVGKHTYTSYPKEFDSPLAAERSCAEEALNDLVSKYDQKKSLLLASVTDILERIPPILEKHNHGIWGWQLELDYADMYKEQLPADWLKVIDSSPCIQVEKCSDYYVLRHCKPGDKGRKWNTFMTLTDVSVPSNTVQFGEDGKLYAEVTCVMSANEVWCRQLSTDESEVYSEMILRMEAYYNLNEKDLVAEKITEAGYYVIRYDGFWYRVRAVSTSDTEVHCFFIDYGDEMAIPRKYVYQLKREFALSQAQAFVCRLAGLEELYEASTTSQNIQSLLYKQVVLEMATSTIDNAQDVSIPVFMYDIESGDSINQEMIPVLTIESASPVITKESITEVYVSNIESNGDVYVQLHSPGYESLQTLLSNLEAQILSNPPTQTVSPITKANSKEKTYFARYKIDGHWYRTQLIDWSPRGDLAQIYFVDYGNTDVVDVTKDVLYPLDKLSDVLNQYPFQAVKVKIALDEVPEDFATLAAKAMPEDQPVLLKILDYDEHDVPRVEFFKRNADGGLFCINKSVAMEAEIKKEDANQKNTKKKLTKFDSGKNIPSGGSLARPALPNKGEYFEVHVPFAVNPYNFFVQPFTSRNKLFKMMTALQDRYKDVAYSPLQVDQIVPGNIYASKYEDGCWYRTSVIKVISSGSISVFYCDFGYYGSLTVQQLIPLDVEFIELPYQALKAKLSDIRPKKSNWTVADCDEFKSLIEKKNFYSIILDIEKDELYESDIVLKLMLIDTSSEEDVYIGKELIKKGIAIDA